MSVRRVKVYRNIDLRQQWFGLELPDALLLLTLLVPLMVINKQGFGLNVLIEVSAYVSLRLIKRGKPEGWTTAIAKFYLRSPFYSAAARDVVGAAHPFVPTPTRADGAPRERHVS